MTLATVPAPMPIAAEVLSLQLVSPMSIRNRQAQTFAEAIGTDSTLLVFLRHFG